MTMPSLVLLSLLLLLLLLLLLSLLSLSLLFSWCAVFIYAPDLRDPVVMWVLSDFYWRLMHKFSRFCLRHQNMSRLAWLFWGSVSEGAGGGGGGGGGGGSHQSCMSLRIGTNNIVGGSTITFPAKCGINLFIHSQTSGVAPFMFGNG